MTETTQTIIIKTVTTPFNYVHYRTVQRRRKHSTDLIQKCVEQEQLNEESWHKKHDEVIAMHYDNYENDMFDYDGDALASCGFGSDEDY